MTTRGTGYRAYLRLAMFSCLLSLLLTGNSMAAETSPPAGILVYEPGLAPLFRLSDMDGLTFDLEAARGHWVFVHFWASWCGPCREEMPAIQRLDKILQDDPPEIVLINTAEDEDTIFSFLAELAPELSTYMDRDGSATEAWQPRGLPATYLVDPQGRIRYQALGGRPWDEPDYLDFLRALKN